MTVATRSATPTARHHDFHPDLLQRELVVDQAEQLDRAHVRHVLATHLDTRPFPAQFRMRFIQFPVEKKRNVSIKSLLQGM